MRKLFTRIFLSFWLLFALISIVTFVVISERLDQRQTMLREAAPVERIFRTVTEAQRVTDKDGRAGLTEWLRRANKEQPLPIFLVDEDGNDLLGRELPEYMHILPDQRLKVVFHRSLALDRASYRVTDRPPSRSLHRPPGRSLDSGERGRHLAFHAARSGPPIVTLDDGTEYLLVPDFGGITITRLMVSNAPFVVLGLAAMIMLSGIVCFLLAQHVTQPLTQLRSVIQHWGNGKLDTKTPAKIRARKDELAMLARNLDDMAGRLHTLIESQQQLVSDVSHELRSPLARVVMAAALLRRKLGKEDSPELDRIEQEVELLGSNIDRILYLARLEAQSTLLHGTSVNIHELVQQSVDNVMPADSRELQVTVRGDENSVVSVNPDLLRSAFDTVLSNAVKYCGDNGHVEVTVRRQWSERPGVVVQVRDDGPGVPEEMLERIFERFVRVDPSRHASTGGLGLGLAIARRAVVLHGGSIKAANREPSGLEVTLFIPSIPAPTEGETSHTS